MNHQEDPFSSFPEDRFLYLSECNAMLNLEMIGLVTFEGAAEDPSCVVHISGDIPPLVLRGKDIERLATALHIDFQAVQTDLQQSRASRIQKQIP